MSRYTKGVDSSIERSIIHLKSKHRIHVVLEWRPQNYHGTWTEEIRSQIVIKEMSLFEAIKRSNNLEKLYHAVITIEPTSMEDFFGHGAICHKTQKQTEWWECALIVMRQYDKHHYKTMLNSINNLLTNCAETSSGKFTMISSFYRSKSHSFQNLKKAGFPEFFSQLPKTRVLNFCSELETLDEIISYTQLSIHMVLCNV